MISMCKRQLFIDCSRTRGGWEYILFNSRYMYFHVRESTMTWTVTIFSVVGPAKNRKHHQPSLPNRLRHPIPNRSTDKNDSWNGLFWQVGSCWGCYIESYSESMTYVFASSESSALYFSVQRETVGRGCQLSIGIVLTLEVKLMEIIGFRQVCRNYLGLTLCWLKADGNEVSMG